MLLVAGAGGLVGRAAVAYFRGVGGEVATASHHPGGGLHIDLADAASVAALRIPTAVTHALVCSSITNIDECFRRPVETGRFNVDNTIALLRRLLDRGVQPVYCSSDLVFLGDRGNYAEDDPREPATEYGRQKKVVEDFLLGQAAPSLILRMSKLYSTGLDDTSPIAQMVRALLAGNSIRCAYDQVVCPTWVEDVPRAVHALLQAGATGTYHVAAPERFTRLSLGVAVAAAVGRPGLVERCSIRDFTFAEPRPLDNSLRTDRLTAATGFRFHALAAHLPAIVALHRAGQGAPR